MKRLWPDTFNLDPPTSEEYLAMSPEERERDLQRALMNIRLKIEQVIFYERIEGKRGS